MKLGFNEATALGCAGQSLERDLELCEKYGFDYIELRGDCLRRYLEHHTLTELAGWFRSHRLKPWAYNTLEYFNQRDAAGREEIDRHLDFIARVCDAIDMHLLITVPTFGLDRPLTIGQIRDEAAERLGQMADRMAPCGVRISLEFCGVPACSINQFGTACDVVRACGRDNVGITLDTFHFHAMASRWEDLEAADPKKIFAYHLNDSEDLPIGAPYLLDDKRLWPEEGCVDHGRICGILNRIGFDGVCTIEEFRPAYYALPHEENVAQAYARTRAFVDKYYGASR